MKLSAMQEDMLFDYKNNTPQEIIDDQAIQVNLNDYILLNIALSKHNQNEYLEKCLNFLYEVKIQFVNRDNEPKVIFEFEGFEFNAYYKETIDDEGLPTASLYQEFMDWSWGVDFDLNEDARDYIDYRLTEIIEENK